MFSKKAISLGATALMTTGLLGVGGVTANAADQVHKSSVSAQAASAQPKQKVFVYIHARYDGARKTIRKNDRNLRDNNFPNGKSLNDSISSAINKGKRAVTFYADKNYNGRHGRLTLARGDREAHFGNKGMGDQTSSIKFRR